MAKNTLNSQFRKIDVDSYGDDVFKEEDATNDGITTNGVDERQVSHLINSGKHVDALKVMLNNSAINSKNTAAKDNVFAIVLQILMSIRVTDIDKAVDALSTDQIDVLMKYIYRGFESPTDGSSAHLLIWHQKTYDRGGVGAIVRVLTDKKRV
ncbi:actin-related protein 2/3 complex subunit 5-B-like [Oppia nitens]|uniref:actin-related protein 2/3 complex subunit 5-B-like n=1 Tax=Oppia nitens TaxID=1686743 RepID=UPI0023DACDB7|nr:actin-related protein 2/3 complex subunit 5-B-like [Oppia nitens]